MQVEPHTVLFSYSDKDGKALYGRSGVTCLSAVHLGKAEAKGKVTFLVEDFPSWDTPHLVL